MEGFFSFLGHPMFKCCESFILGWQAGVSLYAGALFLFWGGERVFPSAPTLFFSFGVASGCLPLALPFALRRRFFRMVGERVFPSVDGFMVSPTREPMSIMMGSQIHGPGDLWIHGFMVSRIRESRGSWDLLMAGIHGFMDSWIHGFTSP